MHFRSIYFILIFNRIKIGRNEEKFCSKHLNVLPKTPSDKFPNIIFKQREDLKKISKQQIKKFSSRTKFGSETELANLGLVDYASKLSAHSIFFFFFFCRILFRWKMCFNVGSTRQNKGEILEALNSERGSLRPNSVFFKFCKKKKILNTANFDMSNNRNQILFFNRRKFW